MSNAFRQARDTRLNRQQRLDEEFGRVAEAYARKQEYDEQKQRQRDAFAFEAGVKQLQDPAIFIQGDPSAVEALRSSTEQLGQKLGLPFMATDAGLAKGQEVHKSLLEDPNVSPEQAYASLRALYGKSWERYRGAFIDDAITKEEELKDQLSEQQWSAWQANPTETKQTPGSAQQMAAGAAASFMGGAAAGQAVMEQTKPEKSIEQSQTPAPSPLRPRKRDIRRIEAEQIKPGWVPNQKQIVLSRSMVDMTKDPGGTIAGLLSLWESGYEPAGTALGAIAESYQVPRDRQEDDNEYFGRVAEAAREKNLQMMTANINAQTKERAALRQTLINGIASGKDTPESRVEALTALGYTEDMPAWSYYMRMTPEQARLDSPGYIKQETVELGKGRLAETSKHNRATESISNRLADSTIRYRTSMANTAGENAKTSRFRANAWAAHLKIQEATAESKGKQITPQASASMMSQVRQTSKRLTEISELLAYGGYDVDGKLEPFDDEMIQALKDEQFVLTNTQNKALDIMGSGSGSVTGTTKTPSGKWLKTEFRPETQHIIARGIRIAIANGENETWEHFLAGSPKKWRGKDGKGTELRKIWDDVHQKG